MLSEMSLRADNEKTEMNEIKKFVDCQLLNCDLYTYCTLRFSISFLLVLEQLREIQRDEDV